jgi:hypothetical protein
MVSFQLNDNSATVIGFACGRWFCFKFDMKSCYCSFFSDVGTLELEAIVAFGAGSQTDWAVVCCQVRIA